MKPLLFVWHHFFGSYCHLPGPVLPSPLNTNFQTDIGISLSATVFGVSIDGRFKIQNAGLGLAIEGTASGLECVERFIYLLLLDLASKSNTASKGKASSQRKRLIWFGKAGSKNVWLVAQHKTMSGDWKPKDRQKMRQGVENKSTSCVHSQYS